ncbi:MAG: arsenate reductase ArsC [Candidatus Micrarchaeota archaeon]|nr:arsenate reductase ArsC [Candidatus Micrarchaeota archaeon]
MKIILFVCTENSARSQMAEGFFNFYNKNPEYVVISAGTEPAKTIKPFAIEVMKERGIDISKQTPKVLTLSMAQSAYKIYTMGCIETCPLTPPEKTEDWELEDPGNRPIRTFRKIRTEIEKIVKKTVHRL